MSHVVVVGAGLAGLAAAGRLTAAGEQVTVLERDGTVGGRVRSREMDGFVLDRGFQVLFTAYPAVRSELDLDALDLRTFRPGATIVRGGARSAFADPLRDPWSVPATLLSRDATLGDKLRLARLRRDLSQTSVAELTDAGATSIDEFLADRGFSERFRRGFVAPFFGGITLDRSLETSSFVFEYVFKMLGAGDTAVPAAGMGAIPAQLAARAREAGAEIRLETPVESLRRTTDGATVETATETFAADGVVVATDPASARDLAEVESIPTAARGCVTQYFALPDTQRLHVRHPLLLNADGERPNHVAVLSDVAPEYAPDRRQLLGATFLGRPDDGDETLAATVRASLESWFPENRFDELTLLATDRIDRAQTVQPPGFRARTPDADAPDGPVYLAGDYTRWSSIQGALESGKRAAEAFGGR